MNHMKPLTIAPSATFSPDYKAAPILPQMPSAPPPPEPQGTCERSRLAICSAFLTSATRKDINKTLSLMSPKGRNAQASLRPIRAAVNGTRPGTGLSAERMSARALRAKTDLPGVVVGYKAAHPYPHTLNRRARVFLFPPNIRHEPRPTE
jgi:hypothetical protein